MRFAKLIKYSSNKKAKAYFTPKICTDYLQSIF